MADQQPTRVILSRAHRDAIIDEVAFAFESASDLSFMLEHGAENSCDRDDARDLIWRLLAAVRLLDQLGWHMSGNQDNYVLEVDADIDRFAARLESEALGALKDNHPGLFANDDAVRAAARRLIDVDLDALSAAQAVRGGFKIARAPEAVAASER
jgi:hypothetical protein